MAGQHGHLPMDPCRHSVRGNSGLHNSVSALREARKEDFLLLTHVAVTVGHAEVLGTSRSLLSRLKSGPLCFFRPLSPAVGRGTQRRVPRAAAGRIGLRRLPNASAPPGLVRQDIAAWRGCAARKDGHSWQAVCGPPPALLPVRDWRTTEEEAIALRHALDLIDRDRGPHVSQRGRLSNLHAAKNLLVQADAKNARCGWVARFNGDGWPCGWRPRGV
mmetsp:Transcript_6774/g.21124  ORF Transcript_6774/g.21124 Transcript_6774/m.21124 type:complete len:217 (-) Transcript_6774:1252-1902(-)